MWVTSHRLQVMSPRILQRRMNGLTHRCSSTDREKFRLTILLRVLRRSFLSRIWTMSKFVLCWLHTVFAGERSKCGPITNLSLCKRTLGVKFISSSEEYGETRCVVFKQKEVESRSIFRQRRFFLRTSTGSQNTEPLFRFSNPENSFKSFVEEQRDKMHAEAKSEVRKRESTADYLDSSVRDLQRQLDSNRLELYQSRL